VLPEEGQILTGPQFSEPVRVETVRADGPSSWVLGVVGIKTERRRPNGFPGKSNCRAGDGNPTQRRFLWGTGNEIA
jgi:hypothetical protein